MLGKNLSAEQILLMTLVVKLAVMAALATMLVRYRRFRHILIFERRAWPDRLTFALSLGIPLTAGVASRLLLNHNAADLTLEGSFIAGLIAGPYAGATVGAMVGVPPLFNGEWIALLATVLCVATPIKIWNNARIEHRLQEQEKLLLAAKIEALANQINPHFLFNTLASISSLIRTQPDTARMLITKLSGLLRRLMRSTDHFVTLREELESIDEYLDIEVIRFGPNLQVDKQISPQTLDVIVPSMILQPLIENSIKHGLARKVGGGRITIRTAMSHGHTVIEVHDDGLGMSEERLEHALGGGIGLSNVNERLQTIYGANCHLKLTSTPGEGTCARVEIPELTVPERVTA